MRSCTLAVVLASLLASSAANAGDRFFGVSTVWYNASVLITARCRIFNAGTKPVTITSLGVMHWQPTEPPVAVDGPECTGAPLAPLRSCAFAASLGVYAGGFAIVRGSTKNLRGDCTIFRDDTTTAVLVLPMR